MIKVNKHYLYISAYYLYISAYYPYISATQKSNEREATIMSEYKQHPAIYIPPD